MCSLGILTPNCAKSTSTVPFVKSAGCSDEEILKIVANVALFTFANYINLVIATEIDFPLVLPVKLRAAGQ
jgi:alkylhydroperoxidase family enzyme